MRHQILVGAVALVLAGGSTGFVNPVRAAGPPRSTCCYGNPRYAGACAVDPAQGETCSTILAYLNDPLSQGKTYCANTSVRGGWRQRRCVKPAPPE